MVRSVPFTGFINALYAFAAVKNTQNLPMCVQPFYQRFFCQFSDHLKCSPFKKCILSLYIRAYFNRTQLLRKKCFK